MTEFSFRASRSLGLRLWHWLNFAVLSALLATVLLRDELVDVRENRDLIQQKLATLGAVITPDQAKAAARLYLERLWDWHVDLGLVLAALLVLRLVVAVVAPAGTGLFAKLRLAARAVKTTPTARKFAAVKASHVAFYGILTLIVVTGLLLAYAKKLGIADGLRHEIGDIHEVAMYGILAFIALHLIGVVRAEKTTDPGLVSGMIHGD